MEMTRRRLLKMEMTRRRLLKMLPSVIFALFGLRGIKALRGKCRFWFEYVEYPGLRAWNGGHWQLYKSLDKEIPIKVILRPLYPLSFPSFMTRRPAPGEIRAYVARHRTLDMSQSDMVEFTRLLKQSFGYQFRSELVPGTRLEICDGTFLCTKMESILAL